MMMSRKNSIEIKLTQRQKEILERLSIQRIVSCTLSLEATIVLKAADGTGNTDISREMKINRGSCDKVAK